MVHVHVYTTISTQVFGGVYNYSVKLTYMYIDTEQQSDKVSAMWNGLYAMHM